MHNLENNLLYQAGAALQTKALVGLSTEAGAAIEVDSNLTEDFLWLAWRCGFRHIETLRLALSAMPGTRAGSPYKFEPVYVFRQS